MDHLYDNEKEVQSGSTKLPLITLLLVIINSLIFTLFAVDNGSMWNFSLGNLLDWGANFSGLTLGKEGWRLFTSLFMHGNMVHLVMNMLALLLFGIPVERMVGRIQFSGYYLLFGVGANLCSLLFNTFTVSVGASGVIFGISGYYFMRVAIRKKNALAAAGVTALSIAVTIVINILIGLSFPMVDMAAHVGGLVTGMLCGLTAAVVARRSSSLDLYRNNRNTFVLSVIIWSILFFVTFFMMSRDRVAYYDFFKTFVKSEKQASQLQENYFSKDGQKTELDSIVHLWLVEKGKLYKLENDHNTTAVADRDLLKMYVGLKLKSMNYLQRMAKEGSFLFLDSFNLINNQISAIPPLRYGLDFYPDLKKNDSLKQVYLMFDKNWCVTSNPLERMYFRRGMVDKLGRLQGWVCDYYNNNTVQMKSIYHDNIQDGFVFYYYPNGKCKSAGLLIKENAAGRWQDYYKNGKLQSEIQYHRDGKSEMVNYYDSTGTPLLVDGNGFVRTLDDDEDVLAGRVKNHLRDGIWLAYYKDGTPKYKEEYRDGNFIAGESNVPGKKIVQYKKIHEGPEPINGWRSYRLYIDSAIVKSGMLLRNRASCIELFIDSTGEIKEMKPKYLIGSDCEDTLMAIIKRRPLFKPGKERGAIKGMRTYVWGKF